MGDVRETVVLMDHNALLDMDVMGIYAIALKRHVSIIQIVLEEHYHAMKVYAGVISSQISSVQLDGFILKDFAFQ